MGGLSRAGDECLDVFILIKLTLLPEALVLTIFGLVVATLLKLLTSSYCWFVVRSNPAPPPRFCSMFYRVQMYGLSGISVCTFRSQSLTVCVEVNACACGEI